MPYAPGIDYRGDQYIAALGSRIGDLFSGAIDKTQELRKQAALNDTIVNHALSNGLINQEEYNKYVEAPWAKKQGVANGIMANMHDDWQRKQFELERQDKAAQRALSLQIAQMAHAPSSMAFKPIFGPAPEQDPAYADRGLDLSPTGEPVPTTGPQVGVYGETGTPHFFPWRDVAGATAGTEAGAPVIDNSLLPGSSVITMPGTKQLKIVPNAPQPLGTVMEGEGIPKNTLIMGAGGKPIKLDKATTRRLNAQEEGAPPTPTPGYVDRQRANLPPWFPGSLATPTPTPMVGVPQPPPVATPPPAETPVPTVVAPPPAVEKVKIYNPDGKPFMIPRHRLQDYINAGWTAG
jgi:hypothetical protein